MAATVKIAVLADSKQAKSELRSVGTTADAVKSRVVGLGTALKTGLTVLAAAGGAVALKSVKQASDLNETLSKSAVIFGKNSRAMRLWSADAYKSTGLSQSAALAAAAGFGDMFTQIGFAGKAAAKMSRQTVQMAADLGSFSNVEPADVADRISAAYRGEYDSLQALIPNINAARVEQEALTMSHKKNADQLTAKEKALAVNAILTRDGARAMGDYSRTSNGLANVTRTSKAELLNLSSAFGKALLPGLTSVAIAFRDRVLPALSDVVTKYGPKVNQWVTDLGTKLATTKIDITGAIDTIKAKFTELTTASADGSTNLGQSMTAIKSAAQSLKELGAAGGTGLTDTLTVTGKVMGYLADHSDALSKAMPYLVGGIVAYKAAQIAANVAALAGVPLKMLELVVNYQLAASNRALVASRGANVAASTAENISENVSVVTRTRSVISLVAHRVAMIAGTAATWAMSAAQTALNFVLSANPIGLVVLAVAALVAGLVIAYKKSETFRNAVNAFGGAIASVWGWVKANWPKILVILTGPIGLAVAAIVKYKGKIFSTLAAIPGQIKGVFAGAGTWLSDAASKVITGFVDGLQAGYARVKSTLGRLTNMLPDWKGPAAKDRTILYQSGRYVLDGFDRGLASKYGSTRKSLTKFTTSIAEKVTTAAKDSQAKLKQKVADLIQARNDYAKSVADAIKGGGITSLVNFDGVATTARTDAVVRAYQDRLAAVRAFTSGLNTLSRKGLGTTLLQQLAGGGIDQAGGLVAALRNASPAILKQIRALDAQITRESNAFGTGFAGAAFAPRINAAQAAAAKPVVLELRSSGSKTDDLLLELLRKAIRARGGNVQVVLGRK